MKPSFVTPIIKKLAARARAKLVLEPKYNYAGQIEFANGRRKYFKGTSFDLNPLGSSEIAQDKAYATFFMNGLGYKTIEGESFFTRDWCKVIKSDRGPECGYRYARQLGFPVIVKPNSLSQGAGVCKVHNRIEFMQAVKSFSSRDRVFLVQKAVTGRDYRVVVLNDEVISAYERTPLAVVGDGQSSVRELLKKKQRHFVSAGRDTVIKMNDFRTVNCLRRRGLSMNSVPERGERVVLLDNANLSSGGDAVDVTSSIHPTFYQLATSLTRDMGLRFCGVDLMLPVSTIEQPCNDYHIIEINAAPGLDHYAEIGRRQRRIVDALYLKVLEAMRDLP
jgi:D-alanine-D-alanine ligase-like ATP-grasp enzyme